MTPRRHNSSLILMAQHGFLLAVGMKTITVLSYWSPKTTFFSLLCCRFTKQNVNNSIGYFEETVPAYFGDEFGSHFRLIRNTCAFLSTEIVASGHMNLGNEFGQEPNYPEPSSPIQALRVHNFY